MEVSFDTIRRYMYDLDPMFLTGFPIMAPYDEYDGEADRLQQWLAYQENPSIEEIISVLQNDIFKDEVALGERMDDYELFAKQIFGTTTAHKCPVCRKTLFPSINSHGVCEGCGWVDDLLICDDGKTMTEANPLPLLESQLEHWMLTDDRTKQRAQELLKDRKELSNDDYIRGLLRLFWEIGTCPSIDEAIEDTLDELRFWDACQEE